MRIMRGNSYDAEGSTPQRKVSARTGQLPLRRLLYFRTNFDDATARPMTVPDDL